MIGKVGADEFGDQAIGSLVAAGVDCSNVLRSEEDTTGLAAILVNESGENSITVAPGANAALTPGDVSALAAHIGAAEIVMMQMEIPPETVEEVVRIANQLGTSVMLDPAPAPSTLPDYLSGIDYLTPNEHEAEQLTGIRADTKEAAEQVVDALLAAGAKHVALTMSERGALIAGPGGCEHIPPFPVNPVDTTGAGDVFNGFLATSLVKGMSFSEAARMACAASALSVARRGARANLPSWGEARDLVNATAI